MTETRARYEFVAALTRELPDHSLGAVAELASIVIHLGAKHRRLALALCHGQLDQPDYDKRQKQVRERLTKLLGVLGIDVLFSGDPRGPTVRLKFRSGRSNTFGNDAWSVPT